MDDQTNNSDDLRWTIALKLYFMHLHAFHLRLIGCDLCPRSRLRLLAGNGGGPFCSSLPATGDAGGEVSGRERNARRPGCASPFSTTTADTRPLAMRAGTGISIVGKSAAFGGDTHLVESVEPSPVGKGGDPVPFSGDPSHSSIAADHSGQSDRRRTPRPLCPVDHCHSKKGPCRADLH